jgi:cell division protein FtsQ
MKNRYKKTYRTKKKRSFFKVLKILLKSKFFWLGLLFLAIVSGLFYLFIFSSIFQIKEIRVSGANKSPIQEIKDIISANAKNIFLTNLEGISNDILARYPQIGEVKLKRKLPDKLLAQIEERKPIAIFSRPDLRSGLKFFKGELKNDYFFVDNQGVVFEETDEESLSLPVIKSKAAIYRFDLGQEIINKDYLEKILKINTEINNNLEISEISLISENRLNVKTLAGWEIYFNPKQDLAWQVQELAIILKEKIPSEERDNLEYIDLRFDKVYIKRSN